MADHHYLGQHRTYLNTVRSLPPFYSEQLVPLTDRPHEVSLGLLTARMDSGPDRRIIQHSLQTESDQQIPVFNSRRIPMMDPVVIPPNGGLQERLHMYLKRPYDRMFESELVNKRLRPNAVEGPDMGASMDAGSYTYYNAALAVCNKISELTNGYTIDASKDLNNELDEMMEKMRTESNPMITVFAEYLLWLKALNIPNAYNAAWESFYKRAIKAADFRFAVLYQFHQQFYRELAEYMDMDVSKLIEFHRFFLNAWPGAGNMYYYPGSIAVMVDYYSSLPHKGVIMRKYSGLVQESNQLLQRLNPFAGNEAMVLLGYGMMNCAMYIASGEKPLGFWANDDPSTVQVQAGDGDRQRLARLWMMGPTSAKGDFVPMLIPMLTMLKHVLPLTNRIPTTWSELVYVFAHMGLEGSSIVVHFDTQLRQVGGLGALASQFGALKMEDGPEVPDDDNPDVELPDGAYNNVGDDAAGDAKEPNPEDPDEVKAFDMDNSGELEEFKEQTGTYPNWVESLNGANPNRPEWPFRVLKDESKDWSSNDFFYKAAKAWYNRYPGRLESSVVDALSGDFSSSNVGALNDKYSGLLPSINLTKHLGGAIGWLWMARFCIFLAVPVFKKQISGAAYMLATLFANMDADLSGLGEQEYPDMGSYETAVNAAGAAGK